jgi:hypothetical protein
VYYGTLMRFAGCAATSHEIAAVFGGDDIVVRARGDLIDPAEPGEAVEFLAGLGVDAVRLRALGGPAGVAKLKAEGARADCEVGADLTARLGLPEAVRRAVLDSFERFDGLGVPAGRAGAEVAEASRFAAVGYAVVMFDAVGGGDVAAQTVARWSGRALDPAIVAVFTEARRGSYWRSPARMTCGRPWSTPSRRRGASSATNPLSRRPSPGSGTPRT